MGVRPQDHRERDLLLGSLLRDHRLPMFRTQCHELPSWAPQVPERWPRKTLRQAQQLIMLGAHQQSFIAELRNRVSQSLDPEKVSKMLDVMDACLPRGALFSRKDATDPRRHCGYARLCPWCHARSVQGLYHRLLAGPCAPEKLVGKRLVMLRVFDDSKRPFGREAQQGDQEIIETFGDHEEVLLPSSCQGTRDLWREELKIIARELQMEGAVFIHQISPIRIYGSHDKSYDNGFRHELVLLGTVPLPVSLSRTLAEMNWNYAELEWATIPADTPDALRYMLFGTCYKFRTELVGITVNDEKYRFGLQGAARLQPWFLFSPTQALSYLAATQGMRVYDTLGSWRRSPEARSRIPLTRQASLDPQYGNDRRERAFRNENAEREAQALERRKGLLALASPLYKTLRASLGRAPGSPALRQAMIDAGSGVSNRDARWLVKELVASEAD